MPTVLATGQVVSDELFELWMNDFETDLDIMEFIERENALMSAHVTKWHMQMMEDHGIWY